MEKAAREIWIEGVVQGVGFRPHVYRLAQELQIKGWVLNSSEGVKIWAEGTAEQLAEFTRTLQSEPPRLARITRFTATERPARHYPDFSITHSHATDKKDVLISPDVAICEDCRREIFDPADRRFAYRFTNCTNCGPRFTIIKDVPYDRVNTTMREFPMCPVCQAEYEDPGNRRFHAQPNACPRCGPQITLVDSRGVPQPGEGQAELAAGRILAVKGLGGFHLVCNARDDEAVRRLRQRKRREYKPFAVMCRDLDTVKYFCRVAPAEADLLTSPMAPIVILERREDAGLPISELCPGVTTLGVMLPYTPLHQYLFAGDLDILVMTSANISDEPLITDNQEALAKLAGIADYFLLHNREIFNRCDDSLAAVVDGQTLLYRRARGYVPLPVRLPLEIQPTLACGGELKHTFCLTRGDLAFLSQHLGDLNHLGNYQQFLASLPRFKQMVDVEPRLVAHDLHPEYLSSKFARTIDLPRVAVQHHHAHLASCMADNGLTGSCLGVIADGTGYGTDGAVWGGEFLAGDYAGFERLAHFRYVPLPGGEAAIRRPARMAAAYLLTLFGPEGGGLAARFLPEVAEEEIGLIARQINQKFNTFPTSSLGRLFDAVSALAGVAAHNHYEGQAAMELEGQSIWTEQEYEFGIDTGERPYQIDIAPTWAGLIRDLAEGVPPALIGGRFHWTVASLIARTVKMLARETGLDRVVFSGGVFQNRLLVMMLKKVLAELDVRVYWHQAVPPNDGGLSLGQALIANEVIKQCV